MTLGGMPHRLRGDGRPWLDGEEFAKVLGLGRLQRFKFGMKLMKELLRDSEMMRFCWVLGRIFGEGEQTSRDKAEKMSSSTLHAHGDFLNVYGLLLSLSFCMSFCMNIFSFPASGFLLVRSFCLCPRLCLSLSLSLSPSLSRNRNLQISKAPLKSLSVFLSHLSFFLETPSGSYALLTSAHTHFHSTYSHCDILVTPLLHCW